MPVRVIVGATLCGLGTACSGPAGPPTKADGPAGLMAVKPLTAHPGQVVSLYFPKGPADRGEDFVLDAWTDGAWRHVYGLISDKAGGFKPRWVKIVDPNAMGGSDSAAVLGRGPDRVPIPETAAAGIYQICTDPTTPKICVLVHVKLK
jgi:hypothetical protein